MENFLEIPIENLLGRLNYFSRGAPALLTGGVNNDVASSWGVGDKCLARWSRDGVWYNAEILEVTKEGFYVRFSDYENEDEVEKGDIVGSGGNIPEDGLLDAGVILPWQVGDKCIARWQEDSVWYNAEVLEVGSDNFHVLFIDYGNEDLVMKEDIAASVDDVPEGAYIDQWIPGVDDVPEGAYIDQWIPGPGTPPRLTLFFPIDDTRPMIKIAIEEHGLCYLFINNDTAYQHAIAITRIRELDQGEVQVRLLFEAEGETLIEDEFIAKLNEYCGAIHNDELNSLMRCILRGLDWVAEREAYQ